MELTLVKLLVSLFPPSFISSYSSVNIWIRSSNPSHFFNFGFLDHEHPEKVNEGHGLLELLRLDKLAQVKDGEGW